MDALEKEFWDGLLDIPVHSLTDKSFVQQYSHLL